MRCLLPIYVYTNKYSRVTFTPMHAQVVSTDLRVRVTYVYLQKWKIYITARHVDVARPRGPIYKAFQNRLFISSGIYITWLDQQFDRQFTPRAALLPQTFSNKAGKDWKAKRKFFPSARFRAVIRIGAVAHAYICTIIQWDYRVSAGALKLDVTRKERRKVSLSVGGTGRASTRAARKFLVFRSRSKSQTSWRDATITRPRRESTIRYR